MALIKNLVSGLLLCSAAVNAAPSSLFKRAAESNVTVSNATLVSNSTSWASNTTTNLVDVFIACGDAPKGADLSCNVLYNTTGNLNITQLYNVADNLNKTLMTTETAGIVVQAAAPAFESLSFFLAVVVDTYKTIIITEDAALGAIIARDPRAEGRGPLVIDNTGVIYSGSLTPLSVPVGVIGDDNKACWFFEAQQTGLFDWNSTLRTTYTNFTNTMPATSPIVPVVYQEGVSTDLVSALSASGAVNGLVLISDLAAPAPTSNTTAPAPATAAPAFPVVCVNPEGGITFLSAANIPTFAIAGGYLTPLQAQLLLTIAISNGVTGATELRSLFP